MHPVGTLAPVLNDGQEMATNVPLWKGALVVAEIMPANPALHVQPDDKLAPELFAGQATGVHVVL